MGRFLLAIGLLLALLAVGLTLWQRHKPQQPGLPSVADAYEAPKVPALRGKPLPNFELTNLEGAKMHPSDFKDKVLLVNFWATWCSPCIVEIPWFVEFQKKYGPQGLQVVGISMDDTGLKDVVPFVKKHNMSYTILMGDEKTAEQFGGIMGLPTSFLVDRNGKLYSMHRGLVSREKVEEELVALLGAPHSTEAVSDVPEENLFESMRKK